MSLISKLTLSSGLPKVFETLCNSQLPGTLAKIFYLFLDLPPSADPQQLEQRRRLYDSLVMLFNSMCSKEIVAEELIQRDDLVLLFVSASTACPEGEHSIWRDANFTFLCSLVGKALSPAVVKYIHCRSTLAGSHPLQRISLLSQGLPGPLPLQHTEAIH